MAGWTEFNLAMVGAAAALAGLLIVALSVNVAKIIEARTLLARAAAAVGALVLALFASAIGLIPGQTAFAIGLEIAVLTAIATVPQVIAMRRIAADPAESTGTGIAKSVVGAVPLLAFATGSVLLIVGVDGGYAGIAIGCLAAIGSAVLFSWVALVEVLR